MMFQNKKSSSSWFQYCLQLKISLFSPFICYQKSSKKIFICSSSYIVMVIKSALLYCVDNFRSQHLKFWKNWLFAFWTTLKIKTLLTYLIHNVFHTTRWTRIPKVFFYKQVNQYHASSGKIVTINRLSGQEYVFGNST